jgi:hypothetical protein
MGPANGIPGGERYYRGQMKTLILYLAFFSGQMNTLQGKPVVRLQPHRDFIPIEDGGDIVELNNGSREVYLPKLPPKADLQARPWSIDVRNLGPTSVIVLGNGLFSVRIDAGKTLSIYSNGSAYSLKP